MAGPADVNPQTITCWSIPLDVPSVVLEVVMGCLDPTELMRAGRYHFDHHRRRFVARRAARRLILGRLLGLPPAKVPFRAVGSGKPEIVYGQDTPLHFSGSHSEELAVLAVSSRMPIGVDIEMFRMVEGSLWEVRHLFAERERLAMERVSERDRVGVFFDCWTRKEACVKADGAGLEIALDSFEVPVGPLVENVRVRFGAGEGGLGEVTLVPLTLGEDVSAALAIHGDGVEKVDVRFWDWGDVLRR